MIKTQWIGLWRTRPNTYRSQFLKIPDIKRMYAEIGKGARLVMVRNRSHKSDECDNRPAFILSIVDGECSDTIALINEEYTTDLIKAEKTIELMKDYIHMEYGYDVMDDMQSYAEYNME